MARTGPYQKIGSSKDIFFHKAITESLEIAIHLHDFYEIYIALTDNIKYFIEGNVYELKKGDLILTNNHEMHRPLLKDNGLYGRMFIQFEPQIFSQIIQSDYNPLKIFTRRKPGCGNKLSHELLEKSEVNHLLSLIETVSLNTDGRSRLMTYSYMLQLLAELTDIYEANRLTLDNIKPMDNRVSGMIELIDQDFMKDVKVEALCERLYMDKYYMSHLFKETTGFSIMEYLQSKRIQYAKRLLIEGISITETCYACGFQDYSNFYKAFKKLVGQSPKAYRNNL